MGGSGLFLFWNGFAGVGRLGAGQILETGMNQHLPFSLVLTLAVAAAHPSFAAAPPAGWEVTHTPDVCALDSGVIAVVKAGVEGAQDIFGQGYANTNNGIVVTINNWQDLYGDDEVLVRIPWQARYSAGIRQFDSGDYFIMWNEGNWFRELGNYNQIELEAPANEWSGPRVTITYSQSEMAQALAWLRDCDL